MHVCVCVHARVRACVYVCSILYSDYSQADTLMSVSYCCSSSYFVEVALESLCVEWALILAVLLLDTSVFGRGVECVSTHAGVLDRDILTSCLQGVEELYEWAETDW